LLLWRCSLLRCAVIPAQLSSVVSSNAFAGLRFLIHHPYDTASSQRKAHDGILRTSGERDAVHKLDTKPEVEA
jgi:hypothetical protein